ncbi:MAG: hypothetical protein A3F14_00605 [Gammaproteobacteria bacterium RIFCSPHIGHO2_12_FULL_43_28]|nr:MAG: hypothetical protein A3F14_00605 [Gammaproteobacteria bacterium RIFCSPHIGHO2_12_FULL_43_28]
MANSRGSDQSPAEPQLTHNELQPSLDAIPRQDSSDSLSSEFLELTFPNAKNKSDTLPLSAKASSRFIIENKEGQQKKRKEDNTDSANYVYQAKKGNKEKEDKLFFVKEQKLEKKATLKEQVEEQKKIIPEKYLMEAFAAACFRLISPENAPQSVHPLFDENHNITSVVSSAIPDFKPIRVKPLTEDDLKINAPIEGSIDLMSEHRKGLDEAINQLVVMLNVKNSSNTVGGYTYSLISTLYNKYIDYNPNSTQILKQLELLTSKTEREKNSESWILELLSVLYKRKEYTLNRLKEYKNEKYKQIINLNSTINEDDETIKRYVNELNTLDGVDYYAKQMQQFNKRKLKRLFQVISEEKINLDALKDDDVITRQIDNEYYSATKKDLNTYHVTTVEVKIKEFEEFDKAVKSAKIDLAPIRNDAILLFESNENKLVYKGCTSANDCINELNPSLSVSVNDLKNYRTVRSNGRGAIPRALFKDDDDHINNRDNKGRHIDHDRAFLNIVSKFKILSKLTVEGWVETYRINYNNFDLDPGKLCLFYNPNKETTFSSSRGYLPDLITKNFYRRNDHEIYKKLSMHPVFIFHENLTKLKAAICSAEMYRALAEYHFTKDCPYYDVTTNSYVNLYDEINLELKNRIEELKTVLRKSPDFAKFLQKHGDYAFELIQEEFAAYKQKYAAKLEKKPHFQVIVDSIDLGEIKENYENFKQSLLSAVIPKTPRSSRNRCSFNSSSFFSTTPTAPINVPTPVNVATSGRHSFEDMRKSK